MGIKKYVTGDIYRVQSNEAVVYASCGHVTLIRNCPTIFGRRTVYVRGVADTFFTIPAVCQFRKRAIFGYLTCYDGNYQFHPYRESNSVFPFAH